MGKFHFTLRPVGAIFHNSRSELFHIRRKPNISLKAYDSEVFRNFVDAFPRGALLNASFRGFRQIRTGETVEMFTMLWYNGKKKGGMTMDNYKEKIIDFIEGKIAPSEFFVWFESNPQVLDWLQSMIPQDKTIRDAVEVKIDYFLKDLPTSKQEEVYSTYQSLCETTDLEHAKKLVDLLTELDSRTVQFTDLMNLLLNNYKTVLNNPSKYKSSYVQEMCIAVKKFFEDKFTTVQEVPYDVKTVYSHNKTNSKLWTYVNVQSWLYRLMTELCPDDTIEKDNTLYEKASFMMDVCPEYIEGHEIDEAGIIEAIIEQVPESLPKAKRKKQIKELIKKEFHIVGTKYPRWVQGGEWPVSKSGKPMRFVEQKRKKGKEYQDMLYTIYVFEDVDTFEKRIIEQFT